MSDTILSDNARPSPPDRLGYARVGLLACAIGIGSLLNPIGFLALALAIFLPRFRLAGWWAAVLLSGFILVGMGLRLFALVRDWQTWSFQAPGFARFVLSMCLLSLLGAGAALWGLLAPGTRAGVERRALERDRLAQFGAPLGPTQ